MWYLLLFALVDFALASPSEICEDLSTGQPARASSSYSSDTPPSKAVDGNLDQTHPNQWHSANEGTDFDTYKANAWWGVQLKNAAQNFDVKIYLRNDHNENGSRDIEVVASNTFPADNTDFGNHPHESCGTLNNLADNSITTISCAMNKAYAYVILRPKTESVTRLDKIHFFHLPEVVVTSCAGTCTSSSTPLSEHCIYQTCEEVQIPSENLVLRMFDAYGDGWNGNTIFVNGHEKTLSSGSSGTSSISSAANMEITDGASGSYASEVSWSLKCLDGTVVAEGTATATSGFGTFTNTCPSGGTEQQCTSSTCPVGHVYNNDACSSECGAGYVVETSYYAHPDSRGYCVSDGRTRVYEDASGNPGQNYTEDVQACHDECIRYHTESSLLPVLSFGVYHNQNSGYRGRCYCYTAGPLQEDCNGAGESWGSDSNYDDYIVKYYCVVSDTIECGVGEQLNTAGTACECSPGYKHEGTCVECEAGQYQDQAAQASCKTCPSGKYQNQAGQPSCETCTDLNAVPNDLKTACQCKAGFGGSPCAACTAGQYSSNGVCTPCGDNQYQDLSGQFSCKTCVNGYTNNAKTTCTLCPLHDIPYTNWTSGCPEWSTVVDNCFCNCGDSGFEGDHCDICGKGKGWNGVLGADANCTACAFPFVNDQTSHSAVCSHDFCPPGSGTTSDEAAWLADNSTIHHDNCVPCTGNTVSPDNYGQCVEIDCGNYFVVKDVVNHSLSHNDPNNCKRCTEGYIVGPSCQQIQCVSGRMKTPHSGDKSDSEHIDYELSFDNQTNCIACADDEVVSSDRTSCQQVQCPDGHKINVTNEDLAFNDHANCDLCTGFTYADGTECKPIDCGNQRVKPEAELTHVEGNDCADTCAGADILDASDKTQCVPCTGETVPNDDHTECVPVECPEGFYADVTDRTLDYDDPRNCKEIDECPGHCTGNCSDLLSNYVCNDPIELGQGIQTFASENLHICPTAFKLSWTKPTNIHNVGLREGSCPPLKVIRERLSIHEGNLRSQLFNSTHTAELEDGACKYTYKKFSAKEIVDQEILEEV